MEISDKCAKQIMDFVRDFDETDPTHFENAVSLLYTISKELKINKLKQVKQSVIKTKEATYEEYMQYLDIVEDRLLTETIKSIQAALVKNTHKTYEK